VTDRRATVTQLPGLRWARDRSGRTARKGLMMEYDKAAYDAAREMTVGEHIDQQVAAAERHLKALYDLKASLPGSFLSSGAGRITPLLVRLTVG
jgi:hypothetical protein